MEESSETRLISWLIKHIETDENGCIELIEIYKKINMNFTTHEIGRTIKKVPPLNSCLVKTKRSKSNYKVFTKIYYGLKWRDVEINDDEIKFEDISSIQLEPGYFVLKQSSSLIKFGLFNGCIVNGCKNLTEISFETSGHWFVTICEKNISLIEMKISNEYELTKTSIKTILGLAKKFTICSGVEVNKVSNRTLKYYGDDILKEKRQTVTLPGAMRYRIKSCKEVVPFQSISELCINCRKILNHEHTDNAQNGDKIASTVSLPSNSENVLIENSTAMFNELIGDFPDKMQIFLRSQAKYAQSSPYSRRWDEKIIRMCLTMYCRSPKTYDELTKSGFMVLPSKNLLQTYKNRVKQEPGIQNEMLKWMQDTAKAQNLSKDGYVGGLMFDEMSIQEDIEFRKNGSTFEFIGFKEVTHDSGHLNKLTTGKDNDLSLASHVLQLMFLGHSGFRFPFAHFPTGQVTPMELYSIFWTAVQKLSLFGFTVTYVSLDGAQSNRDFMKLLIGAKTTDSMTTMMFPNIFDPSKPKICIIMDYSHVMKKIRNNVYKSGVLETHKKRLMINGCNIHWEHWFKAYQWDLATSSFKIYQKLTMDHFSLTSQSKMRNKLAEDVLNSDMLNLMINYKNSLSENKMKELCSTIDFLKQTSILGKNFRDVRPITEYNDNRLNENRQVLKWFQEWEQKVKSDSNVKEKEKSLLSFQTREDIISLLLGFDEMCKEHFKSSSSSILPYRINSDVLENTFCQQRGLHNGANTNPTYLTYCRTMNTIILGETPVSKKSNAAGTQTCVFQRKPNAEN